MNSVLPQPSHTMRRKALALPPTILLPTPERRGRGDLELVQEDDPDGWPVAHCRVLDVVERLGRNGLIQPEWVRAAGRFRRDFHDACFDPLVASDAGRVPVVSRYDHLGEKAESARRAIAETLRQLGGMGSPTGSILWFVVGLEISIPEWARRQRWGQGRPIRHEVATGILIGALGALAAYYAEGRRE